MEEMNAGYIIQERISIPHGTFVLGHNPNAPAPYVTWEQMTRGYYHHGNYFTDEVDARLNMLQRAIECLPREQLDRLALSILSEAARADLSRQEREENAWADIENCFYPAAEYLNLPTSTIQRLLNDPEVRCEAFRVYWNQDHSYENEALQESLELMLKDRFPEKLTVSHEDVYESISQQVRDAELSGEACSFIDICAEQILNQKNHMLVVWGEENDTDDKFWSVSVYLVDKDNTHKEQLLSSFSDSESFEDLRHTVLDVLDQFDAMLAHEAEKGVNEPAHMSLTDQIHSAQSRQGREEVPTPSNHKFHQQEADVSR